jgi:hypothetical protein
MNPVLILGAFAAGALLWLLCSFLYRPLGKLGSRLVDDAKEAMFGEKTKEEDKEN